MAHIFLAIILTSSSKWSELTYCSMKNLFIPICVPAFVNYWSEFQLLLIVGAKLEHIITQLAKNAVERTSGDPERTVVKPSDELFWFHRPLIVLYLIHFILFQNSFEIAFFFWIVVSMHSQLLWVGKNFNQLKLIEQDEINFPSELLWNLGFSTLCSAHTDSNHALLKNWFSSSPDWLLGT